MRFFLLPDNHYASFYQIWLSLFFCILILGSCVDNHSSHSNNENHSHNHNHNHNHKENLVAHPEIDSLFLDMTAINQTVDWHKPLENPIWQSGKGASHMKEDDTVIGIIQNGQAYALPWWIMKNHHIANLTLGEEPILVTLCELCGSGSAFKPIVNGQKMRFLQHGIYKGTWFMRDEGTSSFWLPFEGKAFYGNLKDSTLTYIDTYQIAWKTWLEENPMTQVLYDSQNKREGHGSMEYFGYDRIPKTYRGTLPDSISTALPMFEIVLGVGSDGIYKAYSMTDLDKIGKVLEDTLPDGSPVVVFHKPNTTMNGAFFPSIDGKTLTFTTDGGENIVDTQTGSRWNYLGKAIEGELKDSQLKSHFFITKEWYGWYGYHPNTDVFKLNGSNQKNSD